MQVVASDLDIAPGQSGSNVWDGSFYTRALMNAEDSDGRAYHRTMSRTVFDIVVENRKVWSVCGSFAIALKSCGHAASKLHAAVALCWGN